MKSVSVGSHIGQQLIDTQIFQMGQPYTIPPLQAFPGKKIHRAGLYLHQQLIPAQFVQRLGHQGPGHAQAVGNAGGGKQSQAVKIDMFCNLTQLTIYHVPGAVLPHGLQLLLCFASAVIFAFFISII